MSLGVDTRTAMQLAAVNEDDVSCLSREHVMQRLKLLQSTLLPPKIILRSPGTSLKQPNEFWPLLDPSSPIRALCDLLYGIGAQDKVRSHQFCALYCTSASAGMLAGCIFSSCALFPEAPSIFHLTVIKHMISTRVEGLIPLQRFFEFIRDTVEPRAHI